MDKQLIRFSKFMSLVLRHEPEKFGLTPNAQGWIRIDDLLEAAHKAGLALTREQLHIVVDQNEKQRFALSPDGSMIRARQGHSIQIDLGLVAIEPPELLYHGTAERFLASIRAQGLLRQARQHVHLSADAVTATKVGQRHGKAVVLVVESGRMQQDGFVFYQSENGVWLVDAVPSQYVRFPS